MTEQRVPGHLDLPRWLVPAAAIAAILLVYTSYLGFIELPAASGRVDSLGNEVAGLKSSVQELNAFRDVSRWSGPVPLGLLMDPPRSGPITPEVVDVDPGQPFVPLAVMARLPQDVKPDDRFRFRISRESGEQVWEAEMKASQIKQALDAVRFVTFLIPAGTLADGDYYLVLTAAAGGSGGPLWQRVFTVERQSPAATSPAR